MTDQEADELLTFTGRMRGRDAEFAIYPDRLEWSGGGRLSKGKVAAGLTTAGASVLFTGINRKHRGDQVLPVASMTRVAAEGNILPKLEITTSGRPLTIKFDDPHMARRVASLLSELIGGRHPTQQRQTGPATPSVATELRQLVELRDDGVLTEEEFQARKTRLLDG